MTKVEIFSYNNINLLDLAFEIRNEVFVEEQNVGYSIEFDGLDHEATHILVFKDNVAAGTARWRETSEYFKLERFAVLEKFRKDGIGRQLLDSMLEKIQPTAKDIFLNAQVSAMKFYAKWGFEAVGEEFMDADIPHYKMILKK